MGTDPPDDWPYADEPRACAVCGRADEKSLVVDSLGLIWGGAFDGGPAPTSVGDYTGTLAFRCCHDCWRRADVEALADARTLLDHEAGVTDAGRFALDDRKVAAAARIEAERVAVGELRPLDLDGPEREHLRAQDEAVEALLESRFDDG